MEKKVKIIKISQMVEVYTTYSVNDFDSEEDFNEWVEVVRGMDGYKLSEVVVDSMQDESKLRDYLSPDIAKYYFYDEDNKLIE
jgi:spore cortex formation protein SpoVR/YcgB (stage V sporulation)